MAEEDLWETLKDVAEVVGQAQAMNRASQYILMELVRDIAREKPHPDRYVADLFERISARADQAPIEREAHAVIQEFRSAISTFFAFAGKGLGRS